MGTTSEKLFRARQVSSWAASCPESTTTACTSANVIAALFIATGQDAAIVGSSELSASASCSPRATTTARSTARLIVGTYGGGTGLATQRECLELLGCYGTGKVRKLAEMVRRRCLRRARTRWAIVLAEWVRAHDLLGRNRP